MLIGLQLAVAMIVAPLLIVVGATRAQVAAAAVVAMLAVLGLSKVASAHVTVWSNNQLPGAADGASSVTTLLVRSRRLLTVLVTGPALALAWSLLVLAFAGGNFALAMAGVAGVALVVRARQAGFVDELVPIGGAGVVGLFGFAAALAERIWHVGIASIIVLTAAGLALLAGGAIAAVLHADTGPPPDMPPGFPAGAGPPDRRRRFIDIVGMLCTISTASLALGVFGVFHELMAMGRAIVG